MATPIKTLAEVKTWLSAQTPGGNLDVGKSLFDAELVGQYFTLISDVQIALDKIVIDTSDDKKASVKGDATFLGYDGVEVTLEFTESDTKLQMDSTFDLKGVQWGLVDALKLGVGKIVGNTKTDASLGMIYLEMDAELTVTGKDYPLPIKITIPSFKGEWQISGSFKDLGNLTSDIIGALTGIDDISSIMPSDLVDPKYIQLTGFEVSYDPFKNECSYLKVGIGYINEDGWSFLSDLFIFQGVRFEFEVFNLKVDKKDTSYQAMLAADFEIAKIPLQAGGTFPDKAVFARLQDNKELHLKDALKSMHVNLPEGFPDVVISKLGFLAHISENTYSFEIAIDKPVEIVESVKLENFEFSIQAETGEDKKVKATGLLGTQFKIGETTLGLKGNYKSDGVSSLSGFGENIPAGDLITMLTDQFGIDDVPEFISKLVIDKITVQYSTDKKFSFYLKATTTVTDKELQVILSIDTAYDKDKKKYTGTYSGTVEIGGQLFKLKFDNKEDSVLSATWEAKENPLNLQDLAQVFGDKDLTDKLGEIPENMDLALKSAGIAYNFTSGLLVITAASDNYGHVYFVADRVQTEPESKWVFALGVGLEEINMKNVPLIGDDLAKLGDISIKDLSLIIISDELKKADTKAINAILNDQPDKYPNLPDEDVTAGVAFSLVFDFLGTEFPFHVGTATGGTPPKKFGEVPETAMWLEGDSAKSQNGFWITIDKGLGPIYFSRIGANYSDGSLYLLLDVAMIVTVIRVDLMGLSVGSKLSKFDPEFGLSGVNIAYSSGPIMISGGFLAVERDGFTEYIGQAMIQTPALNLSALGAYAKVNGDISLFIFAMINKPPIGGYPYFYITGLAGGFGYNRSLVLPSIEEVVDFPLVSGFVPGKTSPFSGGDPTKALRVLADKNVIPVDIGQYWLAAGIQFTSFQLLQSFALLAVQFGNKLEIALLGISSAGVPTGVPRPLMQAQLALSARILPEDGIISVEAQLTQNSFILDTNCHLIGGFAFYVWFGNNEHAGNFVVSLGGYHPNFNPPDYYPSVPRLGFNWIITSELSIKGGMYFALTPSCLMAGGAMEAVWKSGNLKAWFTMGAHFLVAWKPYHYEASLYVSFGVSYTFNIDLLFTTITKTISVSLGAGLDIWGPDFSGTAYIHLWIVSFSIDFGASASKKPQPISWEDFRESFLPKLDSSDTIRKFPSHVELLAEGDVVTDSYCATNVTTGLVMDLAEEENNPDDLNYVVRRHGTRLTSNTVIPAKDGKVFFNGTEITNFTNQEAYDNRNKDFGIGPVDVKHEDLTSSHEVHIDRVLGAQGDHVNVFVKAVIADVPKSLWEKDADKLDKDTLVTNVLVGFEIWTGAKIPDETPWVDPEVLIHTCKYPDTLKWEDPDFITGPVQPAQPIKEMESTIADPAVRPAILQTLVSQGFDVDTTVDVSHLATQSDEYLLADPIFAYEYMKSA